MKQTAANGVITGLGSTVTGTDLIVTIGTGKSRVGGVLRSFGSTTNIDFTGDPSGSNPKKALIVINSAGAITKRLGTAAAKEPTDSVRRQTVTPDPPELVTGDVPLVEVWLDTSVSALTSSDLSDRRQDVLFNIPRTAVLTADSSKLPASGAPTAATINGTNISYGVLDYADGSTTSAFWSMAMPADWFQNDLIFKIRWQSTATTGNVVWDVALSSMAEGSPIDIAFTAFGNTTGDATDASAGDLNEFTLTFTSASQPAIAQGNLVHIRLQRLGGHANDTMVAAARLIQMTMEVK